MRNRLTEAQWKVIKLIADGHNTESIASQLGISPQTVKRHKANIFIILEFNSTLEVVVWYYQKYWTLITPR